MRTYLFRRALGAYSKKFAAERVSMRSLSDDHWLVDYSCPKAELAVDFADTTARMWVAQLALCLEDRIRVATYEYYMQVSVRFFFLGDESGCEMVTPAVPTYLTMVRDMIRMLRLTEDNPTATLRLPMAKPFVQFGVLLEPSRALWVRPEFTGDMLEQSKAVNDNNQHASPTTLVP